MTTSYSKQSGIAYATGPTESTDDPLRQFDLYFDGSISSQKENALIVFVHGGAWRTEDKHQHEDLARKLLIATRCPVAVPNYRLTPPGNKDLQFRHPMHAQDLLAFLNFLQRWTTPPCGYDTSKIVLIGHSCSAHMIASILLDSKEPSLVASSGLLRSIKAVIASEGIYDFDKLVANRADYLEWFIEPAFGPPKSTYNELGLSALHWPIRQEASNVHWLLIHSTGDSLVDTSQSKEMHAWLESIKAQVELETESFREEHDEVLKSESYVKAVADLVAKF